MNRQGTATSKRALITIAVREIWKDREKDAYTNHVIEILARFSLENRNVLSE